MSRVIKFRVWSEREGRYLKANPNPDMPLGGRLYLGEERAVDENGEYDFEPSGGLLEQFTGLQDRNGRDIYEGDIVRIKGYDRPMPMCCGPWRDDSNMMCGVGFYLKAHGDDLGAWRERGPSSLEVIGNIHENKDLLKP